MSTRIISSNLSLVSKIVRRFCTRIRLDMHEENVVLERMCESSYNINFICVGNGPKGLILMPGALGTIQTDFKPQIEGLPKLLTNYTIVGWDPPGYGKSRPPERTFPVGFYHRDAYLADKLMIKLGFEEYSIVGWSDGGATGLIMASIYPEAVKKVAIWGSSPILHPADIRMCQSMKNKKCFSRSDTNFNAFRLLKGIRDVSKWTPQRRESFEMMYGSEYFAKLWMNYVDGIKHLFDTKSGQISVEELRRIEAKILILNGAKDSLISQEHVPFLRKTLKSTE